MSCILKYRDVSTSLQCFNEATPCKWCITCISMQCTYLHIYADIKEFIRRTKTKLKDSRKKTSWSGETQIPLPYANRCYLKRLQSIWNECFKFELRKEIFQSTYIFLVINTYVALILDSSDSSLYFFAMYCTFGINIDLNQNRVTRI